MSLEEKLDANTAALNTNTAAIKALIEILENNVVGGLDEPKTTAKKDVTKSKKLKNKETPAEEETEVEETEEDESMFEAETEVEETEVTLKDLQNALKGLVAEKSKDAAKKLLKKFGVAKLPDLEEEKYGDLLAAINKQLKK